MDRIRNGKTVYALFAGGEQLSAVQNNVGKILQNTVMTGFHALGRDFFIVSLRYDKALLAFKTDLPLRLRKFPKMKLPLFPDELSRSPVISSRLVPGHSPVVVIKDAVAPFAYSAYAVTSSSTSILCHLP